MAHADLSVWQRRACRLRWWCTLTRLHERASTNARAGNANVLQIMCMHDDVNYWYLIMCDCGKRLILISRNGKSTKQNARTSRCCDMPYNHLIPLFISNTESELLCVIRGCWVVGSFERYVVKLMSASCLWNCSNNLTLFSRLLTRRKAFVDHLQQWRVILFFSVTERYEKTTVLTVFLHSFMSLSAVVCLGATVRHGKTSTNVHRITSAFFYTSDWLKVLTFL